MPPLPPRLLKLRINHPYHPLLPTADVLPCPSPDSEVTGALSGYPKFQTEYSVVFENLPELIPRQDISPSIRRAFDKVSVNAILSSLGLDSLVIFSFRMGVFSMDHPRPLKVVLQNSHQAKNLVASWKRRCHESTSSLPVWILLTSIRPSFETHEERLAYKAGRPLGAAYAPSSCIAQPPVRVLDLITLEDEPMDLDQLSPTPSISPSPIPSPIRPSNPLPIRSIKQAFYTSVLKTPAPAPLPVDPVIVSFLDDLLTRVSMPPLRFRIPALDPINLIINKSTDPDSFRCRVKRRKRNDTF